MKSQLKLLILAVSLVLAFSVVPNMVLANDEQEQSQEDEKKDEAEKKALEQAREAAKKLEEQRKEAAEKRQEEAKKAIEEAREDAKQKAEEVKEQFKKACENRRENYKDRLENIAERSKKHLEVLDKIVDRVKQFKESKNLSVENYEALLAEIEAKKAIVHDLQEAAKQQAEAEFSCERDEAKESVESFKDILSQQIDAIKNYKTAVKNLIVAVKTAAETAQPTTEGDGDES